MSNSKIDRSTIDRITNGFLSAITSLQSFDDIDLSEIVDTCDIIGSMLKHKTRDQDRQGLLLLAQRIIGRANSPLVV